MMDGDHSKSEARNKPFSNQSHRQPNSSSQSQGLNLQPTNHQLLRGSFSQSSESSLESHYHPSDLPSHSQQGTNESGLASNHDHRHSLSSSFTANGASSDCFVASSVVKASSTGTLSTSSSRCYAQVVKSDSSNVVSNNSEYVTTNSNISTSGTFFKPPAAGLSLSANLANGNADSVPLSFTGPFDFPRSLPSTVPPQNQDQAMHNWQDNQACVKERLAYLHKTDIMSDIQFRVGKPPTELVSAHKFVLSIGSAVFDALFNGRLATTETVIDIPDVEPAAFSALLKFLYTDEVQIGPETVMTTLYAAKKYAVPALERECVDFLKHNLSPDNAFMLLTQARLFDEPQLAALCLETIDKNTAEALSADGFTDIDLDTLCAVLERDTLGIRECRLFAAVSRWAEAECVRQNMSFSANANKRQVLCRALQLIRFPLMTVEEFAMGPAQSGILEDREVVELFLFFTVNPKPTTSFLDVPRCCLTGKEQVVSRFCQIESRWGYSGTSDRIRFLVNRRIFVVGFGLYGSIHGPTEYSVNIQIIHMDSTKVLGSNEPTFQCDGSTSTFRVMFKEPVEILPNTSYIACATLKGPDSYYGSKGLRKVTHESVASGKVTFQFTYAAGNNNGTSVEDGQIPEIVFYT